LELIMAKKKREQTTRRMSSGAQQFVREGVEMGPREMSSPTTRRMKTIDETIRALDRSTVRREPRASRLLTDAFIDESRSAQKARETERQTIDEDRANRRGARKFAEGGKVNGFPDLNNDGKVTKADILKGRGVEGFKAGGMVTGSRAQLSGTKFSGTF
jgi:hypothetical protein